MDTDAALFSLQPKVRLRVGFVWVLHRPYLSFLGMLCPRFMAYFSRAPALLTWRSVIDSGGLMTTQTNGPTPESQTVDLVWRLGLTCLIWCCRSRYQALRTMGLCQRCQRLLGKCKVSWQLWATERVKCGLRSPRHLGSSLLSILFWEMNAGHLIPLNLSFPICKMG